MPAMRPTKYALNTAGAGKLRNEILKQRYSSKWARSTAREYYVANLLNAIFNLREIPAIAIVVGFGAGVNRQLRGWHRGLEDKWDIAVVSPGHGVVAFIDVTGYESPETARSATGDSYRCIGAWKIWNAEDYGVLDMLWFAHVTDETAAVYFLKADVAAQKAEKKQVERRLYKDENPVYCFPLREWRKPKAFIDWLRRRILKAMSGD